MSPLSASISDGPLAGLCAGLLDVLYPRRCVACGGEAASAPGLLCWDCLFAMRVVTEPFCQRCGDPVDGRIGFRYTCPSCRDHAPAFDAARSAVRYRGPARALLRALKYQAVAGVVPDGVRLLASCVAAQYPKVVFDTVTAVPLYPVRERERSFNQSALLAGGLAKRLRVPSFPRAVKRIRDTPTQTALTAAQRRHNVRGAFAAADGGWLRGRTVLLVDDVMTTGATVNEVSRVLRGAGARAVYVVTVARG